ncbi:Conserved_hypothetical protein [Hexamita inflata]|uniref:Uncharacterized protein n=1 Tax=Hexamita inflata TaxID=28002 RepID=A0AA86NTL8_9EUKA|nr:Conserved hypothetical protein [Hexamita inflata]
MSSQIIVDSTINISTQFQVVSGALLCLICDVEVRKCTLVFIASGLQVSGMIIEPKESITMQQSFIQFRISSMNSSGLTNIINQSSITILISQCKLAGSNQLKSENNGYIASAIFANILLNITQFVICVDQTPRFGQDVVEIKTLGYESVQCDVCDSQFVVYGLCGEMLKYSENVNGMLQCVHPFEYMDSQCKCASGYLLNNSKCIDVVESINAMSNLLLSSGNNYTTQLLNQVVENVENKLILVDQRILSNTTDLEQRIISNFSQSDHNLLMNTSTLDNRIYQNISQIKTDILAKYITVDTNLLSNTTILDRRIFNNVSILQQTINNQSLHLNGINESILQLRQIVEQQQQIIDNMSQQINCTSKQGYSMANRSCIQISCAISGQQSINGICQCTIINSIVKDSSCICPINANVIGTACVCSINGQTMQNGSCACSTVGAFVQSNACTCGQNSFNISNTCSCPSGAILVNGACTCSNVQAYISGDKCVCPTFSSLVGNTCTCPSNSQIVSNECICNLISGQVMKNGICKCQTTNAYVNNGACICGVDALNVSNVCTCPAKSSLVNNVCTCDQITGQQMITGICSCPSDQYVVNNSCNLSNYVITTPNFECSQEVFSQSFYVQSTLKLINNSGNFSAGYVFNAATQVENAFIDISDNVYTSSVYPLFQSQSTFMNFKIQFGTQTLNSGSFIISSSTSISINQMNIISRPDSQLKVSAAQQLSILTSSTTSANISNLLVNLSFSPSSGNISLFNNINGVFSITGYQILGSYVSTGTIAMIGVNLNAATVKVSQISFQPTAYNVGNCSSYLFGQAVTTASTLIINNFAVIIGNSSNFLLLGSISTISYDSNYYQFGGLIAYISSASTLSVCNVLYDSFQQLNTNHVSKSGFLVGYVQSSLSTVQIYNLCIQQNMSSSTLQFVYFGLIGWNGGNISFINVSAIFTAKTTAQAHCFGLIGLQFSDSLFAEVINVKTSSRFISTSGTYVGSIFGAEQGKNCSVQNIVVVEGYINSGSNYAGGFSGNTFSNIQIQNATISQMNISGTTQVGGFIGYCESATYLINLSIQQVRIYGSSDVGVVIGLVQNGVYSQSGSSSTSNYINGILKSDCAVLSNWLTGC